MSLIAPVTDGKVNISETSQDKERKVGSSLDKEDFLMLLVTQMKYQDPLEPTSNTEYVAQLAQFSELEQMQNLNQTTTNTSAYTLVGKQVRVQMVSPIGGVTEVQGVVDYVTIQNGKAKVCVEGQLYDYDNIVEVLDDWYVISQYLPSVQKQSLEYLHHDPQNLEIKGVDLGEKEYSASSLAVVLLKSDGTRYTVDASHLTYKDGKLTIDKEALKYIPAGEYKIAFVFDDINSTVDYESVSLSIKGNAQTPPPEDSEDSDQVEGDAGNENVGDGDIGGDEDVSSGGAGDTEENGTTGDNQG